MHSDLEIPRPARRVRKQSGEKLRDALLNLAGGLAQVDRHTEQNWASITFAGTRHSFTLTFEGNEAVEAGENFIALLPDHEFTIIGQLVAMRQSSRWTIASTLCDWSCGASCCCWKMPEHLNSRAEGRSVPPVARRS